jgi:hypothetical protein
MWRDAEEIVRIWRERRDRYVGERNRMRRIRDAYNGDLVLPFDDNSEPAVANMVLTGIDQHAGRISSVMPQLWFPPTRPGFDNSEKKAAHRREAVMGWWDDNKLPYLMRQRARYLVAYGSSPVIMRPNFETGCPEWRVRNPLNCYPSEDLTEPLVPADQIAAFNKPWGWVRQNYPWILEHQHQALDFDDSDQVVLLEFADSEWYRLIYAGVDPTWEPGYHTLQFDANTWDGTFATDLVEPVPNKTGYPLSVMPHRVNLDRAQGQFDQILGMYSAQAKLTALEMVAVERDVFPDQYLVSRPNETAVFVHGPFDGRTGEVNVVKGGEPTSMKNPPGYQTTPMIDRLERGQRITSAVPPEFGGESTTNIRTGRRGDAVLSAVIDYPIMEAQEAFAVGLECEDRIGIKISRAWFGDRAITYHYVERGRFRQGTYRPDDIFNETDYHKVSWPVAGADLNALVVGLGQRIGLGTVSKQTAAELDPLVNDPERERDRITAEALEAAMLASIQTAAAEGGMPPEIVARVSELVRSGVAELPQALAMATAEAKAAQPELPAGPTGAEGMMAELGAAATGAPAAMPTVPEAGQGLQNLSGLMNALRKTNTRSASRSALGGNY